MGLKVGDIVRVTYGMNEGQLGVIIEIEDVSIKVKYASQLIVSHDPECLTTQNVFQAGDRVRCMRILGAEMHNGKVGTIMFYNYNGVYSVKLDDIGYNLLISEKYLKITKEDNMMEFKDNKFIISIPKNLSNRQKFVIRECMKSQAHRGLEYIKSFSQPIDLYYTRDAVKAIKRKTWLDKGRPDKLAEREPNHYFIKAMRSFDATQNHKPSEVHLGEWIGVEIECFISFARLQEFSDENIDEVHGTRRSAFSVLKKLILDRRIRNTSIKNDGSISPNHEGDEFPVEFTVVFQRNNRQPLIDLCKLLKDVGAMVNKSCGLHVHLDQRDVFSRRENGETNYDDFDRRLLFRRARKLEKCLELFRKMVPNSRRNNSYCRFVLGKLRGNRYTAINMAAFRKYYTIEVRLHSSTTDLSKINNWIDILLMITNSSHKRITPIENVEQLCEIFNVPEHLIEYIEQRIAKFSDNTVENNADGEEERSA